MPVARLPCSRLPGPPCVVTSDCSDRCSGTSSASRKARRSTTPKSASARHRVAATSPPSRPSSRRCPSTNRAGSYAPSRCTSSSPTSPSSTTASAAGASTRWNAVSPPSRSTRRSRELEAAGVSSGQLRDAARRVSLELVLTAHPTEATRRTVLTAQLQISELLHRLDDPQLSGPGKRDIEDALAEQITTLWQTDETRAKRPRVVDEIRHGLWFFEQSLFDVAPALVGDYRRRIPGAPLPLRFGSWIGGDQDGNPNTGPDDVARGGAAGPRAGAAALRRRGARAGAHPRRVADPGRRQRGAADLDRRRRTAARRRHPDRADGLGRRRAVPSQAVADASPPAADRRRHARGLPATCTSSWPTSTSSTPRCARIAANASPTVGSLRCAGASSCSASTWRNSTCGCTPAT